MAKKIFNYLTLPHFKPMLTRLLSDSQDFTLCETSYTKKIIYGNYVFIFNENGEQDKDLLQLIRMVREDASAYNLSNLPKDELKNNWFDLTEKPEETIIAKVDVKSAYWETALKMGVISEQTNAYLCRTYEAGPGLKLARLKALGSLATKKSTHTYVAGRRVASSHETQPTKELYMYVCSVLDEIMQGACYNLAGAFYYYWDCVFVSEQYHKDVTEFLYSYEYASKTELTQLDILTLGDKNYFVTGNENRLFVGNQSYKTYPIPPDKQWLLN